MEKRKVGNLCLEVAQFYQITDLSLSLFPFFSLPNSGVIIKKNGKKKSWKFMPRGGSVLSDN
ncbi:hypothetical protein [Dapis sp. BLCC M229]|uniref:hypothetical protein n=1 Tax=Dapis sp. BLCC M229 TaxID=3400188 RepID=UPI003CEF217C